MAVSSSQASGATLQLPLTGTPRFSTTHRKDDQCLTKMRDSRSPRTNLVLHNRTWRTTASSPRAMRLVHATRSSTEQRSRFSREASTKLLRICPTSPHAAGGESTVHLRDSYPLISQPITGRRVALRRAPREVVASVSSAWSVAGSGSGSWEVEGAKARLERVIESVGRGAQTDEEQRAIVEEAQVNLEALGGGTSSLMEEGALERLDGLWRLKYSSASDVLGILRLPSLSPFPFPLIQVGNIYQNFVCKGRQGSGVLQNIVEWSIPGVLEEKGARFCVTADFTVCSNSSLQLIFREAAVDSVRISEPLEALLAPAVLPRTQLQLEALQFLRSFQASVPLSANPDGSSGTRGRAGGRYILTYLDEDFLIGRATAPSGSFIFERHTEG